MPTTGLILTARNATKKIAKKETKSSSIQVTIQRRLVCQNESFLLCLYRSSSNLQQMKAFAVCTAGSGTLLQFPYFLQNPSFLSMQDIQPLLWAIFTTGTTSFLCK